MAAILINSQQPTAIRRPKGSTVNFINQSAVDIYISYDRSELSSWPIDSAGTLTPSGTKLLATTGALAYDNFNGIMWARAVSATSLQVLP